MIKKIRVFYIDDNELDRELVRHALEKSNDHFTLIQASNREEFEKRLQENNFDVVLSDFNILGFEGLEILKLVQEKYPEIPVIIVTGTGSEEIAVETMKHGAWDYVIKTTKHIQRLPYIIKNVFEKKQLQDSQKKAQFALQKSEVRFRSIFHQSPIGIAIYDASGNLLEVNKKFLQILGAAQTSEFKRINLFDTPYFSSEIKEKLKKGIPIKSILEINYDQLRSEKLFPSTKTGKAFIETWIMPYQESSEGEKGFLIHVQDITEKKQAEQARRESEERYRILMETARDFIFMQDINGNILYANKAALRTVGFDKKDVIGKNIIKFIPQEYHGQVKENSLKRHKGDISQFKYELEFVNSKGQRIPVEVYSVPIFKNGKIQGILVVARDITEKRKAEEKLRENEEKFRTIVENSHAGIVLIDDSYRFIYVNKRFAEITGYSVKELTGQDFRIVLDKESKDIVTERYRKRQQGEEVPSIYEFNILRKDGSIRRVEIRSAVVKNRRGQIYTISQMLDITEQKKLEEQLRFEQGLLHALMDNIPDTIYFKDRESRFIRNNKAQIEKLGISSQKEIIGKTDFDFFHEDHARTTYEDEQKIIRTGKPLIGKIEKVTYPNGSQRWVSSTKVPFRDKDGNIAGIVGITRDITDLIKMKEALNQSEKMYRNLIEQSNDAIYLLFNNRFEIINKKFTEIFGYTLEDLNAPDFNLIDLIAPKSRPLIEERLYRLQKGETLPSLYEFTALNKSGKEIDCEVNIAYIDYKGGKATQGIVRDITQRKRAEMQLNRLASVIEQAAESIIITDLGGNIEYANHAFEKITGYSREEVIGKKTSILKSGLHDEEFYRILWRTITSGRTWHGTFTNRRKDGTIFYENAIIFPIKDAKGKIVNFACAKRDITHERELEEQFRQAQKMEAVGKLAGGVAHDFNNILTVINGYCELMLKSLPPGDKLVKPLEQIHKAGEKAALLTNQLLAFSRRQVIQPKILNLNNLIKNTQKILERLIGEDIKLITRLEPNLWNIKIDPAQVDQVIMNLAVNARDAMPRGGSLIVETANVELGEDHAETNISVKPGPYVMLAVTDTGIGMDKETQSHIFEPFFTTKSKGKGTGLGLSTVYGIVKQNGGYIWVYSEPGKGTTFKIYWPRAQEKITTTSSTIKGSSNFKGSETILIAEDDPGVRELAVNVLKDQGYTVLEASNGQKALEISQSYTGPIHLLITDVIMPEMSGQELAEKLSTEHPEAKILYMSGYTDDFILHHSLLEKDLEFIQKPFSPSILLKKIRKVLDRKS